MAYSETEKHQHTLSLENRGSLALTGVTNVDAFNEQEISVSTDWGDLTVKGSDLNVEALDLETGDMRISGTVTAFVYTDQPTAKGFFRRVFS